MAENMKIEEFYFDLLQFYLIDFIVINFNL